MRSPPGETTQSELVQDERLLPFLCNSQSHSSWRALGDRHPGYKDPSEFPVPAVYRTDTQINRLIIWSM